MAASPRVRFPFVFAVALVAAAAGDAVVESLANAGAFGSHRYFDDNHRSVIPALIAGAAVLLEALALRCRALWRASARGAGKPLLGLAAAAPPLGVLRALPYIFALQLGALYVMESAEALLATGALPRGIVWLGGPLAISLGVHAALGAGCAVLFAGIIRAVSRSFASFVDTAIEFILIALRPDASHASHARERRRPCRCAQRPALQQIRDRAPPHPGFA